VTTIAGTRLGRNGLRVSRYGLGTAPLGIFPELVDEEAARDCLDRGLGLGIRYFDSAPFYGAGLAERRLGGFLAEHPRPGLGQDRLVVSTKVGRRVEHPDRHGVGATTVFDFSRDGIRRELDESMRRLRVDHLDLVYIHDPDEHWAEAIDQAWPVLAELRDDGVITSVGAGMNQVAMLSRFVRETTMDVVLLANRYTLLEQSSAGALLAECRDRDVSVVLGGIFNSGILVTGTTAGATYEYQQAPPQVLERVAHLEAVCGRHGVPLAAAAVQFAAAHPAVATVLLGAKSALEIEQGLRWAVHPIPRALWTDLQDAGLLPATAALPTGTRPP
jgi:D-threo-aldose 1-dehydrogenase